ncbi:MAG TPA: COX15/CtaA family protein [Ferruginibacter sp.]|jgi:cytochrome c oxidase assembly protein subunit 15|nr:COX15/CtaA family protein [Ferruginibacter sp.]
MRLIKHWIIATFILTFIVIIAGGVVRTTQSGMGCPDWPTCFGRWIPPTNASQLPPDFERYLHKQDIDHTFNALHTWIEYMNRLSGALLGLFALIQFALLFLKKDILLNAYKLSFVYLAVVILTGLFGALVVKLNLANASISVHLLFAIVLLEIQLALLLSFQSKLFIIQVDEKVKRLLFGFLVIILIQAILGTRVRMYVDDVSKAFHYGDRGEWLADTPVSFLIHRSFSCVVLFSALFMASYCKNIPQIRNKVFVLNVIILLSMITGIVLFYADMPAIAQPIHLLLASLAITQTISILLQTRSQKDITAT